MSGSPFNTYLPSRPQGTCCWGLQYNPAPSPHSPLPPLPQASFKPVLGSQSTMFLPQQAFLRVDSPSGTATVAVAARPSKAGDALIATAGHSALAAQLAPGPTRLSLVLGDASLPLGLEAVLGTLVLGQPAPGRGYKAPVLGPLPEIQHRHRQPERRANPLAPLTALGGVLALGAAFLLALPARLGANLKVGEGGDNDDWNGGVTGVFNPLRRMCRVRICSASGAGATGTHVPSFSNDGLASLQGRALDSQIPQPPHPSASHAGLPRWWQGGPGSAGLSRRAGGHAGHAGPVLAAPDPATDAARTGRAGSGRERDGQGARRDARPGCWRAEKGRVKRGPLRVQAARGSAPWRWSAAQEQALLLLSCRSWAPALCLGSGLGPRGPPVSMVSHPLPAVHPCSCYSAPHGPHCM